MLHFLGDTYLVCISQLKEIMLYCAHIKTESSFMSRFRSLWKNASTSEDAAIVH